MEDPAIVELYWQRSDLAIPETEVKYGAYCRTVAYNILQSAEDAEECVNDTWLRAWNAMPDKRPARLAPFLGRISRNLALNRAESDGRLKRGGGETPLALDELSECLPAASDVEQAVEQRELSAALRRFVSALPETEKAVFVSRYWYLAPVEEIAERFSFTHSKVKSMLRRTRLRLRGYLEKEGLC